MPAEVFADAITEEKLEPIIRDTISNGFAYLRGDSASLGIQPDFSELESNIRTFFEQYAAEQEIEKTETYEKAVYSTIDSAESGILSACDVFRFSTLNEKGLIRQAKPYVSWAGAAALGLMAAVGLFALILFFINMHEPEHGLYWTATAALIASALLMIPAVWLQQERWFDRFAVKTDQTFAAVTGYLYTITHAVIVTAAAGLIAAGVMYLLFMLLHFRRHKREVVRKARH